MLCTNYAFKNPVHNINIYIWCMCMCVYVCVYVSRNLVWNNIQSKIGHEPKTKNPNNQPFCLSRFLVFSLRFSCIIPSSCLSLPCFFNDFFVSLVSSLFSFFFLFFSFVFFSCFFHSFSRFLPLPFFHLPLSLSLTHTRTQSHSLSLSLSPSLYLFFSFSPLCLHVLSLSLFRAWTYKPFRHTCFVCSSVSCLQSFMVTSINEETPQINGLI